MPVETQEKKPLRRRRVPWLLGALVVISFVVLVLLQTSNLWKDFAVETASDTLLLYALSSLNFFAFVIFGFIFLRSILKLLRERRSLQLGSRIKTRLFIYFAAVSLLPIIAMAGFSYLFMNRAIERWFTQIPENVVREARQVEKQAIADQSARLHETASMLASAIGEREVGEEELRQLADQGNLTHIELAGPDGRTLISSGRSKTDADRQELEALLVQARSGQAATPVDDPSRYDFAAAMLRDGRRLIIVPEVRSGESVGEMVDRSLTEFDLLKEQQTTVRQLGFLTLGVLTFLLIFASSWMAFYIARGSPNRSRPLPREPTRSPGAISAIGSRPLLRMSWRCWLLHLTKCPAGWRRTRRRYGNGGDISKRCWNRSRPG
jgi:two-component system, NtrC family, nitrogen regulation sensor histidine kinase NtrY